MAVAIAAAAGCSNQPASAPAPAAPAPAAAADAQHQNMVGPHGDHSPHKGGMVLMNADIHFEVVLSPAGKHQVWFSDAVRSELPASLVTGVTMTISRPGEPAEILALAIDDSGESWVAAGRPVAGANVDVKVRYSLQGEPYEIDLPFSPATPPTTP